MNRKTRDQGLPLNDQNHRVARGFTEWVRPSARPNCYFRITEAYQPVGHGTFTSLTNSYARFKLVDGRLERSQLVTDIGRGEREEILAYRKLTAPHGPDLSACACD